MSNLELLHAGFSAIFGEGELPSNDIHELFGATYTMMQPVEMILQDELPLSDEAELCKVCGAVKVQGRCSREPQNRWLPWRDVLHYLYGEPDTEMQPSPSLGAYSSSSSLRSRTIDVFVTGLHGDTFTVRALNRHTVRELKAIIEEKTGIDAKMMSLTYGGKTLDDTGEASLRSLGISHGSSVFIVLRLHGGGLPGDIDPSGFDPSYDFDFSDVKDDGEKYTRGGHQYHRPYGWKRIAIKVRGKYGGGDEWLGPDGIRTEESPNEWAVSYHGTNYSNARKIVEEGFKPGPREKFGPGVYSSPSLEMVEKMYAQSFPFGGKEYKIALQNRVNPKRTQIIPASETEVGADYWLTQKDDIRPYGVLVKVIKEV